MAQAVDNAFDAKAVVDDMVAKNGVVMIAKSYCPHCAKAFETISKYTDKVVRKDIDLIDEKEGAAIQAYCKTLTGASSVPRVFISGKCVGGNDATQALDQQQKLKPMIDEALK